mmetsp:Transcript_12800/g.40455  ORF Transcript_12800/g.40455 Transcript_12800/m.40455 type:complete len:233 (-) Transcript_12800:1706-2404(-)
MWGRSPESMWGRSPEICGGEVPFVCGSAHDGGDDADHDQAREERGPPPEVVRGGQEREDHLPAEGEEVEDVVGIPKLVLLPVLVDPRADLHGLEELLPPGRRAQHEKVLHLEALLHNVGELIHSVVVHHFHESDVLLVELRLPRGFAEEHVEHRVRLWDVVIDDFDGDVFIHLAGLKGEHALGGDIVLAGHGGPVRRVILHRDLARGPPVSAYRDDRAPRALAHLVAALLES